MLKVTTATTLGESSSSNAKLSSSLSCSNSSSSSSSSNRPNKIIIPPAPIVWAWLSYFFETTGEWLLPPGEEGEKVTAPSPVTLSGESQSQQRPDEAAYHQAGASQSLITYQPPFPTMLPYAPVAPEQFSTSSKTKVKSGGVTTGYNYAASPYFVEAERLIAQAPIRPIAEPLLFNCKLVLALVLAWCHFPLFKAMSGRSGKWMALGYEKGVAELKLNSKSFGVYLTELQGAGLLQAGRVVTGTVGWEEFERLKHDVRYLATEGGTASERLGGGAVGFWPERAIQEKSNIYRLSPKVEVSADLPEFNPFTEASFRMRRRTTTQPRQIDREGLVGRSLFNSGKGLTAEFEVWDMNHRTSGKDLEGLGRDIASPSHPQFGEQAAWEGLEKDLEGHDKDVEGVRSINQALFKSFSVTPCINNHDDDDDEKKGFSIPALKNLTGVGIAIKQAEAEQGFPNPQNQNLYSSTTPPLLNKIHDSYPNPAPGAEGGPGAEVQAPNLSEGMVAPLSNSKGRVKTELDRLVSFLKPSQRAIFNFLSTEAGFEGFEPPLMSGWEAHKFAINPLLTLELVKARYAQALEMWQQGKVRKNPIGLLYRALEKDYDPRSAGGDEAQVQLLEEQAKLQAEYEPPPQYPPPSEGLAEPSPKTAENREATSHTRSAPPPERSSNFGGANRPRPRARREREQGWEQERQERTKAQKALGWEAALAQQHAARKLADADEREEAEAGDWPPDPQSVWQRLLARDLGGPLTTMRPDQRKLLEDSQLHLIESEQRLEIRLRSIFEKQALDGVSRNLIEMALSQQKLMRVGYSLKFEVLA